MEYMLLSITNTFENCKMHAYFLDEETAIDFALNTESVLYKKVDGKFKKIFSYYDNIKGFYDDERNDSEFFHQLSFENSDFV